MNQLSSWTTEELLPHSGHMVLIDRVLNYDDNSVEVEKTIRAEEPFVSNGQVPAWVAIEYMAQAVGAYAGIQAKLAGQPVKVGLLIGSRKFVSAFPFFKVDETFRISAEQIHREESGLCVFSCVVDAPQGKIKANLNLYVPDDIHEYMPGGENE